jgi:hypothetical protein
VNPNHATAKILFFLFQGEGHYPCGAFTGNRVEQNPTTAKRMVFFTYPEMEL